MMINIKESVKDGKYCRFSHYRDGSLWYLTENDDMFPVPIEDIGNAQFQSVEKAILLMRYMRKFNENIIS